MRSSGKLLHLSGPFLLICKARLTILPPKVDVGGDLSVEPGAWHLPLYAFLTLALFDPTKTPENALSRDWQIQRPLMGVS